MSADDQPDQVVCFDCQTPIEGRGVRKRGEWMHWDCAGLLEVSGR